MSYWRTLVVIASAPLIGFFARAGALALSLPQNVDVPSAFDVTDDVGFVNNSLNQANGSGMNGSQTNMSPPLNALDDLEYQCSPQAGHPLLVACRFAQRDMPDSTRMVT